MSASPLRGALIGCGFFAQNHLRAWRDLDDAELVAVCDLDGTRARAAAETFGIANAHTEAETMLKAGGLDFVDIATTMPSHRALVELAARYGVPAIVQKPFAPTLADCEAMVRACADAGVALMVHENFRFQTPIMAVKAALDAGTIGAPFFARVTWRTNYDVYAGQPYLLDEERFILLDLVIHILDVARYLFGEADDVTCRTASIRPGIRGEDAATVMLGMASGATVIVDGTYQSKRDPDPFPETLIEIDGALGTIQLRPGYELVVVGPDGTARTDVTPPLLPWASRPWFNIQESVLNTQKHWLTCLRSGAEPATSGTDNLKTFALAEAAYASAARHATVVPPL